MEERLTQNGHQNLVKLSDIIGGGDKKQNPEAYMPNIHEDNNNMAHFGEEFSHGNLQSRKSREVPGSVRYKENYGNVRNAQEPPVKFEDDPLTPRNSPVMEQKSSDHSFELQKISSRIERLYGTGTATGTGISNSPQKNAVVERDRQVAGYVKTNSSLHDPHRDNQPQVLAHRDAGRVSDKSSRTNNIFSMLKKKEEINMYTVSERRDQVAPPPLPPRQEKKIGVNLILNTNDGGYLETLNSLQQVESYISQCEAEAQKSRNMQRFQDILKTLKHPKQTREGVESEGKTSQEALLRKKPTEHIQEPLKSFNEVENLLKPGVSDLEAENVEPFERSSKARSSTSEVESGYPKNKTKPLSRTVSDAQERNNIPKKVDKTPKSNRLNRTGTQVFLHFI